MVFAGGSPLTDPFAPQKEGGWREVGALAAELERGEIDEAKWHRRVAEIIRPAYLASTTPWEQSGKSGDRLDWESSRSHIADAIDEDGTFRDIGYASGYLMECLPRWTPYRAEPYGLDIIPEVVELARMRMPQWADRIWLGNALSWNPPIWFVYIRTGLEYVPPHRQKDLVVRLLGHCQRLIIGNFNEHETERTTESAVRSWGFRVGGRSERAHPRRPGMEYRVLWIDSTKP